MRRVKFKVQPFPINIVKTLLFGHAQRVRHCAIMCGMVVNRWFTVNNIDLYKLNEAGFIKFNVLITEG